jgi:hypothetical protein
MNLPRARILLILACLFNTVLGGIVVLTPGFWLPFVFEALPTDVVALSAFFQTFWLFVVCMGIGYGIAAAAPNKNPALLWTGAIGKTAFVAMMTLFWAQGLVRGQFLLIASADLAWAALFLWIWAALAKSAAQTE